MDKIVQIMDLDINMIDINCFCKKIEQYLETAPLNVILLASSQLFKEVSEKEELRELVTSADMLIPVEKMMLEFHPTELLKKTGIVASYNCFVKVLEYLKKQSYTMYIVSREQEESDSIKRFFEEGKYNISIVGERIEEESEDDAIINEINSLSPDILFVNLDTPLQEQWIIEHSTKVNSRLCIGLGTVISQVMNEYRKPPYFIRALHLTGLYRKICLRERVFRVNQEKLFKRTLKEYKNKKENEG